MKKKGLKKMDALKMLKERRSVRKFKGEKIDRKIMEEIIETATYAPTWANFQIVRCELP